MKLLLTRADEDARASAARLALLGHDVVTSPALVVRACAALAPDGAFDAALATSAHAFASPAHGALVSLPLYCVGARTASAAKAAGFLTIAHVASDAAALVARLGAQAPMRLIYFVGRDRKPLLETRLPDAGHRVTCVETYRAQAAEALSAQARAALAQGRIEAVLHYSQRSAEIFGALVEAAGLSQAAARIAHLALSQDAGQPLIARGWRVIVAARPDEEALFSALDGLKDRA